MDEELVRRAARGDAESFDALARDRIDRLFAVAYRILRDQHDAEDAVQQALWTAWSDLPGLRDTARFDAWLYRLLVRRCYRAGQTRRRRSNVIRLTPELDVGSTPAASEQVAARDAVERAFAALGTEHRAVVVLHHYLGLGLDEVAATLDIPHGTARSRLHYALQRMRTAVEAADPDEATAEEAGR
jgi:RNA polymerase sigma factor (sigma-70 family)